MTGRELLHFRIADKIGEGGQGAVYKAVDTSLDRPVVIKVLPAELNERTANIARFEREAKLASSLDHPNICTIFGFHKADGVQFISMQYVEGHNVRQLVRGRPLELRSALSIAIQVADALAAAHARGIIHRDIKAGNVMVTDSGNVKVLDFGLAKLTQGSSDTSSDPQLTEVGVPYGTSTYAAPEQALGLTVDHRADIFSTGVLLYEMLVGTWPFKGKTALDVRYAVVHYAPEPLIQARTEQSPFLSRLQEILDRALAKEPEDRYQRIEELRDDLQDVWREIEGDCTSSTHTTGGVKRIPPSHIMERPGTVAGLLRNKVAVAAAAVLVLGLGYLAYKLYGRKSPAAIDSLAVLPFTNGNADPNTEYLSDGITESLINSLSQLPFLKVKSRNTVFHYKGRENDPTTIGKELGVRALLSGRVVQRGDDLAVSVELIDTQDDSQIWGGQYGRKIADVIALPQQISRDVSERLRPQLDGIGQKQLARNYATNSETYRLYLQGRYNWNKRTAEGLQKGIEYFEQAINQDRNYGLAYSGLADCYLLLNVYNVAPAKEAYPKAQIAANKALSIDDTLAEAHSSLAFVDYRYEWKWGEAEQHFKRAIELNPNYATAHQWYSAYLAAQGRHDEAISEARRARELEPYSLPIYADLVRHLYFARKYDEAGKECAKLLEMDQEYARGHLELGQILVQKGMHQAAIAEYHEALAISANNIAALTGLGQAEAISGNRSGALKVLSKLTELSKQNYVSPYQAAVIYAALGQKDLAIAWLERSRDERFNWVPFIQVDPAFDSLRSEARFRELVKSIGLNGAVSNN